LADQVKNVKTGERPDEKAENAEEDSRRKSTRDEDEQDRSQLEVDAFDKGQACASPEHVTDPDGKGAQDGHERNPDPDGQRAPGHSPEDAHGEAHAYKKRKEEEERAARLDTAEDSVKKDGIEDKKSRIGDDEEDLKTSNAEAKRGQRSEKHGGAQLNERLTGSHQPWGTRSRVAIHRVEKNHRNDGKEEAQEPEQGARVAEAEIEVAEGGEEQRRQDECREMIIVGHGSRESPSLSPESADPSILADPGPVLA
jgi:hypothetical protein